MNIIKDRVLYYVFSRFNTNTISGCGNTSVFCVFLFLGVTLLTNVSCFISYCINRNHYV